MKLSSKLMTLSICISFILNSCSNKNPILRKTINHDYNNIGFQPESLKKELSNTLEVIITPVDAKSLNQETWEAANRDGNYEKEISYSVDKIKAEIENVPKQQRNWYLGRLNAIEQLTKLEKENMIPKELSYQLKYRIIDGPDYGYDGTEITSLSDLEIFPDDFNPFKVNNKFLSIFKITFHNKGNEIEKVSIKEFQVVSGEEQLYPLSSDYFENNLKNEQEKVKNAYRLNMPNELVITPNQRITKYISIPAINPKNQNLQIQFIRNNKSIDLDFTLKDKSLKKSYNVESYDFTVTGEAEPSINKFFYVVSYGKGTMYATKDNRVFIDDSKKDSPFTVYSIAVNPQNGDIYFGFNKDGKFANFPKNKIKVQYKKLKKTKK